MHAVLNSGNLHAKSGPTSYNNVTNQSRLGYCIETGKVDMASCVIMSILFKQVHQLIFEYLIFILHGHGHSVCQVLQSLAAWT